MQYRDIDKQALKENGYRVLSKITIVGTNTIFTEDDHIVNWDYEDYRYVPDNGFIGQFVERIFDGNLQDISEDVILEDTEINLQLGIVNALDNNTTTWYDYGNFLVTKVEKTDTTGNYKFESADYTKKFNKVFDGDYTDTTYTKSFNKKIEDKETVTALWLAQYACAQADVELADNEFTNSDFVISSNQYDSDDTLRKVMQDIGKLAYSWVRVGEDNEVHIDFTPKEISEIDEYDELTTDEYYVSKKSDLTFGPVNKVLIGMSDVEGENMYETSPDYTEETECAIKIYDNNLTNTDELRALALQGCDKLFGLTYTPIEINSVGHPWLDGDELIKLTNVDNEVIYTYPFNRKLTYAGYIESTIGAEASTSQNSKYEYKSDIISDVRKTSIIVDKQNQTITALVQNVDDVNSEMSFEKTASGNPIEIEDGGNYQLEDFKLYGNTSQETTTQNANLFDEEYYYDDNIYTQGTYKYTKFRFKGDRYLVFKAQLKEGKTAQSGVYIALSDSAGSPYVSGTKSVYAISNGTPYTRSYDFTGVDTLYINIYPNNADLSLIFDNYDLMVATSNVPYVPFVPDSPSPDYPSEIQNVTSETITTEYEDADFGIECYDEGYFTEHGTFEFKGDTYQETTTGQQLLDYTYLNQAASHSTADDEGWITASYTNDGSSNAYCNYMTKIPEDITIEAGSTYYVFLEVKSVYSSTTSVNNYISVTNSNASYIAKNGLANVPLANLSNNTTYKYTLATKDDLSNVQGLLRTFVAVTAGSSIEMVYRLTLTKDNVSLDDFVYQSYTGGQAGPNPDYPSEVQVVTGKQDVLFDRTTSLIGGTTNRQSGEELYEKMVEHAPLRVEKIEDGDVTAIGFYNNSFLPTGSNPFNIYDYWKENMQYTIRAIVRSTSAFANSLMLQVVYTDGVVDEIGVSGDEYTELRLVTDPDKTISRVGFACEENDESYYLLDISSWFVGEEDSHYYPEHDGNIYKLNLGANSIELCKIGDYRDKIFSIGNLFKVQQTYYPPHDCTYNLVNNGYEIIPVPEAEDSAIGVNVMGLDKYKGIELTCSFDVDMDGEYHYYAVLLQSTGGDNYDYIEGIDSTETGRKSFTFTLPVDNSATHFLLEFSAALDEDNYVFKPISYSNIKIGVGSEYSEETDWYLHKEIGKVVLNGSESNWNLFFSTNGIFINSTLINGLNSSSTINCISNYFSNTYSRAYIRNHLDSVDSACATNGAELILANKSISSTDDFKTWLSTHNTMVYYVLANPTNEKITNADLLEQLNGINTLKLGDVYNEYRTVSDNLPMLSSFDLYKTIYKIITLRDNSYNVLTYNLLLKDMELCKVGNYRDYIHYSNDNWYLHRNIDKIVLDGSENWQVSGTGTDNYYYYYYRESVSPISNDAYSTYFISTVIDETNTNEGIYVTEHYIRIRYGKERTVAEFKQWLQTHIMPVYYPTNNSEDVAIVEPKVIEELNKIKQMYLYSGYNKLYLDDDLVDLIEITYLTHSDFNGKYATKAELQITNESITTTVSKTTESLNELGQRIEQLDESISEQTALSITDWFNTNLKTVIEDLENSADTTSGEIKNIKAYIRRGKITDTTSPYYGQAYIELGDDTNQTTLRILQNRIQFLTNGQETAYISNNQLYINESTILTKEKIGHWVTTENEDGSLDTYWEA